MAKYTMNSACAKRILLALTEQEHFLQHYEAALEKEGFYPGYRYLDELVGQLIKDDNHFAAARLGRLCAQAYGWLRRDVREFNRHLSILVDHDEPFFRRDNE